MCHIDDEKKELVKKVHKLARLGIRHENAPSGGVFLHSRSKYSFGIDVKANQHLDLVLIEFTDSVLCKLNETFSLGGDGVLKYLNRLCVPNVDNLRTNILAEAHASW